MAAAREEGVEAGEADEEEARQRPRRRQVARRWSIRTGARQVGSPGQPGPAKRLGGEAGRGFGLRALLEKQQRF